MFKLSNYRQGFSLVELMLVLVIISILLSFAIPSYKDYIVKAKVIEGLSLLNIYKLKIAEYYLETGKFPDTASEIFSGNSTVNITTSNNITSIHYNLSNNVVELSAKIKNPPTSGKEYIYVFSKLDGEFITWSCGVNSKTNSIEENYYPKSCKI